MQLTNKLVTADEAKALISSKAKLCISGEEATLLTLPKGDWIAGTIPYFMADEGGTFTKDKVFVTDISDIATNITIKTFSPDAISGFTENRFSNGFTYAIVPGMSEVHSTYALMTHDISDIMNQPVFGWISGIDLANLGKMTPKVINGQTGEIYENEAAMMFVELPPDKTAHIDIINIFEQDAQSPTFTFDSNGFSALDCTIDGKKQNLKEFVEKNGIDTKLPLVADYAGAQINISFQELAKDGTTYFYAPVQKGIEYKLAKPIDNYISKFTSQTERLNCNDIAMSCNCILNYLYAELEGVKTGGITGPITFGEIAYILVNQTLVYLRIE